MKQPFNLEEQFKCRHLLLHMDMSNQRNWSLPTFSQKWSSSDSPADSTDGKNTREAVVLYCHPLGSASSLPPIPVPSHSWSPLARPSSRAWGGSFGRPTFFFLQDSSLDRAEMITVAAMRSSNNKSRMRLKLICKGNVCLNHTILSPGKSPSFFSWLIQLYSPCHSLSKPWLRTAPLLCGSCF